MALTKVNTRMMEGRTVATIAALKALDPDDAADVIEVQGHTTAGDGGGGSFRYVSGSSASDDNGITIAPTAGSGRWIRQYSGFVDVKWFGASDGDDTSEDDTAFAAALAIGEPVTASGGTYRLDATVEIPVGQELHLDGAHLRKLTAKTANTDPVVFVKGSYTAFLGPGTVTTENAHTTGIVKLGHPNVTSAGYNALYWRFHDIDLNGVQATGNIGYYVPSSQPTVGVSEANYFGSIRNINIKGAGTGAYFAEIANAHTVVGGHFWLCVDAHYEFAGAQENQIIGGFGHSSTDGVVGVKLGNGVAVDSEYNQIIGFVFEPGGAASAAYTIASGCNDNTLILGNNAAGAVTISNVDNLILPGPSRIQFRDGSASAPSITNLGDTDTGFFFPAANEVGLSTGGTQQFAWDVSGFFGVKETNPQTPVHITAPAPSFRLEDTGDSTYAGLTYNSPATTFDCDFGNGAGGSLIRFRNDGTINLSITGTNTDLATGGLTVASTSVIDSDRVVKLRSYTVATVPSASGKGAGARIYVSDETGGATPAFSDATNWRRDADRAVVS